MSYAESGAITFSAAEAVLLHHAVRDFWVRHTLGGRPPLPAGFDAVLAQLARFVSETKTCASQPHSPPSAAEEVIDTTSAAALLHCSPQWVRRIRVQLDGHNVGGRWLFPRQAVVEYNERKAIQRK
ncbi:helix-turn-helix domain-containing protein [Mycobacterium sp. E2733]|uniref:helix-turn-helix domain-containing protein n=1 Tax=Mycobacterium sp. E2733 TaxID=1834138 RepID=UPI0012EA9D8F|nr:helix-turn-helix domain-containing protein [Mycobacterium sp. E2733]